MDNSEQIKTAIKEELDRSPELKSAVLRKSAQSFIKKAAAGDANAIGRVINACKEPIKPPQPSYMRTKNNPALDYDWLSSKTETESEWLLDDLCNYVINMGSPCQWAYAQGILWEAFHKWINEKPRQKKYFEALMTQNETVVLTLLQDLRDYNSFDIRDVLDDDGKVKPPAQWPDRAAKAIEEMDVTEKVTGDVTYTIRTVRKLKAVEMLMKNLNVLADRVVLCKQVKETGNDFIDKFFGLSPENDSAGHDQDDSKECEIE